MRRDIMIGGTSVPMVANAATDYRIKQVFGVDPLRVLQDLQNAEDNTPGIRLANKLAYVMNRQATCADRKELNQMSEDAYMEWLEQFETIDLMEASADILNLYQGQKVPDVQEKKLDEAQTDH